MLTAVGNGGSTADGRRQEKQHAVWEECGTTTRAPPLRGAPDVLCCSEIGSGAKRTLPSCSSEFLPFCVLFFLPSAVCW
jgi:hypothetical protein